MSIRTEQIESTLHKAISQILQRELSDPRIRGLVSVTKVDVSPDLTEAYVFISVIPEAYVKRSLAGLRAAAGHIRTRLAKTMRGRTVPKLDFRVDESLKTQARVLDAIRGAIPEDEYIQKNPPAPTEPEDAQGQSPASDDNADHKESTT